MSSEQWVIVRLEAHEFALPLARVIEVLRMVAMEPVPEAPAWLAGLVNLRGRALPVMDPRARLGLPPRAPGLNTRLIVVEAGGRWLGLLADEVTEVLTQNAAPIDLPEESAGAPSHNYRAVLVGERLVSILELDRLSHAVESQAPRPA